MSVNNSLTNLKEHRYDDKILKRMSMASYFINRSELVAEARLISVEICRPSDAKAVIDALPHAQQAYCHDVGFVGRGGHCVRLAGQNGAIEKILFGAGEAGFAGSEQITGKLSSCLGAGQYVVASMPDDWSADLMAVFWGLGSYQFTKYLKDASPVATLVLEDSYSPKESTCLVEAIYRGRDLINTPASDMGPVALQSAAQDLATQYGANCSAIVGEDLLDQNYPMIHAVGRAAHEAPRLIELVWGNPSHPRLALVGKGITFDTGGLNIKGASGMKLMKKDMGGAAHALCLAQMIMDADLPVYLQVYLAVAENSISANAMRPSDVLTARNGKTVEIDNTDAEGRLVLGDALSKASEMDPALIIDFATLTGAARIALGPTLPPFFTNQKQTIAGVTGHTDANLDPVWNMPLWDPYMSMLSSPIADMKNAGGSFAGCMTAALFLQQFITSNGKTPAWMHFDVYGWNPASTPIGPKGGEIFAVRGLYHWLKGGGLDRL